MTDDEKLLVKDIYHAIQSKNTIDLDKLKDLIVKKFQDVDEEGKTLLHKALSAKDSTAISEEVIKFILENTRDINVKGKFGETPLHIAAKYNSKCIKLLLQYGSDPKSVTGDGSTAMHLLASYSSNTKALQYLLEAGADIEARDDRGNTPLYSSFRSDGYSMESTCYLLRRGAEIDPKNPKLIEYLTGDFKKHIVYTNPSTSKNGQNRVLGLLKLWHAYNQDDLNIPQKEEIIDNLSKAWQKLEIKNYLDLSIEKQLLEKTLENISDITEAIRELKCIAELKDIDHYSTNEECNDSIKKYKSSVNELLNKLKQHKVELIYQHVYPESRPSSVLKDDIKGLSHKVELIYQHVLLESEPFLILKDDIKDLLHKVDLIYQHLFPESRLSSVLKEAIKDLSQDMVCFKDPNFIKDFIQDYLGADDPHVDYMLAKVETIGDVGTSLLLGGGMGDGHAS